MSVTNAAYNEVLEQNARLENQLARAEKALALACEELAVAFPDKCHAGSPEAWLHYAVAVMERDERNEKRDETATPAVSG